MRQKAKPPRRWPWYVTIGALTLPATLALQSVVVGFKAAGLCGELGFVSHSAAMTCKWRIWSDPAEWQNRWLALITAVMVTGVGHALWHAAVLSRRGLRGGPRDAHSIRAEHRPIVIWLIVITLAALFINLTNLLGD